MVGQGAIAVRSSGSDNAVMGLEELSQAVDNKEAI